MSTALPTTPSTEPRERRRRRGVVFLKFGLAGAALLGIAAAATSAAWTDNAWFSADAHAATVKVSASSDGTNFSYADTGNGGTAITFGATEFGQLNAGVTKTVTLYLRNDGTVPLTVSAVTTSGSGGIFTADTSVTTGTGGNPAAVTTNLPTSTTIPADHTPVPFTVTITTPSDWATSFEGKTGTVTVHVSVTS